MPAGNISIKVCEYGHCYNKSSDDNTCTECEAERKPKEGFILILSAPARRALENSGTTSLQQLSEYSETEIIQLYGMVKSSIPKLKKALLEINLNFKLK